MGRRLSRAATLAALAAAVALGVAACGGSDGSAPAEEPVPTEPAPSAAAAEPVAPAEPAAEEPAVTTMEGDDMVSDSMEHEESDHGEHTDLVEASDGMDVGVEVELDPAGGINVHIDSSGFTFTPENVNGENVDGEGHAHIYVDSEKIGRVYGEWYHLSALEPGAHEIRVTLNANSHAEYARDGEPLEATAPIDVPDEEAADSHGPDPVEAPAGMSVALQVEPDESKGYNVLIIPTDFVFAPEHVNGDHVPGEGHAHLYVDGEKVARVYGEWFHLDRLPDGEHSIRATLNANTHGEYVAGEAPVAATVTLTSAGEIVEAEPEHTDAAGDDHEHSAEPAGDEEAAPEPASDPGTAITLVGGEPVDGVAKIRVKKGETAIFTVSSDTAGEVHVHGLDVTKAVGPGKDTRFMLETSFEGIFEIEFHSPSGETEIASLVIQP
jgi:hypothetical protein